MVGVGCGQRLPQMVEHRAVEPAARSRSAKGRPVRLSAGSASACSAATDERSGQPARTPHASRYRDGSGRHRRASRAQCPPSSDRRRSRPPGRRRWHRSGSRAHPAPPARRTALPPFGRTHPGGRRSVIGVEHFPARCGGGDVALSPSPASSFGRQHGRRLSRRASPCRLGSVVSPQPGGRRPKAVADRPATPPGRSATFARALERAKVAVLSPGVGASTPDWGRFRTLNWTLNAESRPQRERRTARLRAQNPAISR